MSIVNIILTDRLTVWKRVVSHCWVGIFGTWLHYTHSHTHSHTCHTHTQSYSQRHTNTHTHTHTHTCMHWV